MKHLILISCLFLTACGSAQAIHKDGGARIEYSNPLPDNLSREAFFAHPDIQFQFDVLAAQSCPIGYDVKRKFYDTETRKMIWEVECL